MIRCASKVRGEASDDATRYRCHGSAIFTSLVARDNQRRSKHADFDSLPRVVPTRDRVLRCDGRARMAYPMFEVISRIRNVSRTIPAAQLKHTTESPRREASQRPQQMTRRHNEIFMPSSEATKTLEEQERILWADCGEQGPIGVALATELEELERIPWSASTSIPTSDLVHGHIAVVGLDERPGAILRGIVTKPDWHKECIGQAVISLAHVALRRHKTWRRVGVDLEKTSKRASDSQAGPKLKHPAKKIKEVRRIVDEAQKLENSSSSDVMKLLKRKVNELVDRKETKLDGLRKCLLESRFFKPSPSLIYPRRLRTGRQEDEESKELDDIPRGMSRHRKYSKKQESTSMTMQYIAQKPQEYEDLYRGWIWRDP
ncbi:hypothetical protein HBI56_225780 [Parastagonospora nodorum]|uniref:Uncharacterized protein n=1 Tax=Phaeosphaeria nodorum (strain SN15 / ATCC MYA-4574 / FGSC 10173) TaxID=321614 RepID=A0A7U2NRD1_PHANO|nr:hypothetical protein HBH56_239400 [Parastagonospora nodorum]QRD07604.1 hypothetical protein JI435_162840 [Parastagonospora nodorum SN15]KAH3921597.1 hypothetical protein HBH54_236640 [Parastagonospora nodorum]KAH3939772.1 hypothetical protein HBH53_228560 [Parastagonospora nodorum]KAH3994095.1 hypothetical protein HBI10_191850 [Parastagonospora nodorum]